MGNPLHGRATSRSALRRVLPVLLAASLAAGCVSERDDLTAREQRVADDPDALLRIAKTAEQGGDLSGAADFYNRAFTLRPEAGDAAIGLARARARLGQPEEALATLRSARARSPSDQRLTVMLGRLELEARQPGRALETFQEGLGGAPGDAELLTGQGVALDSLGRNDEAQASYRQALARNPTGIAARNNLALSLALSGRPAEAAELLRDLASDVTARGSSAQVATVRGNLALVHGLSGNEGQARRALGASLSETELTNNLRTYARLRGDPSATDQGGPPSDPNPAPAPAPTPAPGTAAGAGPAPLAPDRTGDNPS